MVMVGSNDLLADIGLPGQYVPPTLRQPSTRWLAALGLPGQCVPPRLGQAYERVIAACRSRGKHVGVGGLAARPDLVARFVQLGARYVSTGTDLAFLSAECARRARQVKELKL